jgi:GNAT superfamily N-acetyltransferase
MKFVLRNANVNDIDNLARAYVKCWHETYSDILHAKDLEDVTFESALKKWRSDFVDQINDADRAIFVIENEETEIIGFASCGAAGFRAQKIIGQGEIFELFLRRDHQGYGLGKALMLAVSRWLISRGLFTGGTWVAEENVQGCTFCEDLGAVPSGRREENMHAGKFVTIPYVWNDFSDVAQLEGAVPNWEERK